MTSARCHCRLQIQGEFPRKFAAQTYFTCTQSVFLIGSKNERKQICHNLGFDTVFMFSMFRTCLHWACKRNHTAVVAYLLHAGADKDILTKKGESPAQLASKREIRKMLGGNLQRLPYDHQRLVKGCSKRICSNLCFACEDTVFGF